MSQVRLKCNIIHNDRLYKLGSVIDPTELPAHMRKPEYLEDVEAWRKGKVMLLRDLIYNQRTYDPENPDLTVSYPSELKAGSLIRLNDLPRSQREVMKPGIDYTSEFSREESDELLGRQELLVDTNQESFSMEELEELSRNRHGH